VPDKPLVWLRGEVRTPPFSPEARIEAGILLRLLQGGERLGMPHSRPMPAIGCRLHRKSDMDANKRKRLGAAGWKIGNTASFLGLSPEESALVDMRVALSRTLRERRVASGFTQTAFATQLGSSQSRIAKLEAGDPSVSLDLLIRALLVVGASRKEVATALARRVA
jgi:DNA-binding XRE family transcriptional regulator